MGYVKNVYRRVIVWLKNGSRLVHEFNVKTIILMQSGSIASFYNCEQMLHCNI